MARMLLILLLTLQSAGAQDNTSLTLETCRKMAEQNYPETRKQILISQSAALDQANLNKNFLPQLNLDARASYQSAVTELPFKIPGIHIPEISKDQYHAALDLGWVIYDGGYTRDQKRLDSTGSVIQQQQVSITLDQLKNQVDNLYMNILYEKATISLTGLRIKDLQSSLDQMSAMVKNGSTLPSDEDLIRAEQLSASQDLQSQQFTQRGLLDMMGILIDSTLDDQTDFVQPLEDSDTSSLVDQRPELIWYDAQRIQLEQESRQINSRYLPHLSIVGESGYGRPGLNMLDNNFSFYYLAGVQLDMPVWDWRMGRNQRKMLSLQQSMIEADKETFQKKLATDLSQQLQQINLYKNLVATDDGLVELRNRVEKVTASRLGLGSVTPHDFIQDLDAEDEAIQNQQLHKLQLVLALITYHDLLDNE